MEAKFAIIEYAMRAGSSAKKAEILELLKDIPSIPESEPELVDNPEPEINISSSSLKERSFQTCRKGYFSEYDRSIIVMAYGIASVKLGCGEFKKDNRLVREINRLLNDQGLYKLTQLKISRLPRENTIKQIVKTLKSERRIRPGKPGRKAKPKRDIVMDCFSRERRSSQRSQSSDNKEDTDIEQESDKESEIELLID